MYKFNNANEAFEVLYNEISNKGINSFDNKFFRHVSIMLENPLQNLITNKKRNWKKDYAEYEWNWYLSGDKNAENISKKASIWKSCMDKNGDVNSNYGWHWQQGNQIEYVVNELLNNPLSRRASISIYNAKERYNFENDTPCTYSINFFIEKNKLCMDVLMRSNDLWYGFCNDQYCFSKLQEMISSIINKEVGYYHHYAQNLHIYNNKLNKL